LFERISRELGINLDSLGRLTLEEVVAAVESGEAPQALVDRRATQPYLLLAHGARSTEVTQGIPPEYQSVIDATSTKGRDGSVRGIPAYPGRVTGRVFVVHSDADVLRFPLGAILVANTTHPTYLPAMRKATAIVTNEGGLLSHAAIVAREIKIPCIVGTREATIVFGDGELVSVDASNGIVSRINERQNL
jgi:phosphoenolpyruvate synthase/pyruvate phosphate dikinase